MKIGGITEKYGLAEIDSFQKSMEISSEAWGSYCSGLLLQSFQDYTGPKDKASLRDAMLAVQLVMNEKKVKESR